MAVTRLGVITPSSNTVVEPAFFRLASRLQAPVTLHFTRVSVTVVADPDATGRQFAHGAMVEAATLLAEARVDGILWAGTAGMWEGAEADERLVAAIEAATGVPTTTATLALLGVLERLRVRRYALVVPYVERYADAIAGQLAARGLECVDKTFESLTSNGDFAAMEPAAIADRARRVAEATPDAIVISCTNLWGVEVAEALEQELGLPVLDSVVVGLWSALQRIGVALPPTGFRRILDVDRSDA
jgi:maleate isomerase